MQNSNFSKMENLEKLELIPLETLQTQVKTTVKTTIETTVETKVETTIQVTPPPRRWEIPAYPYLENYRISDDGVLINNKTKRPFSGILFDGYIKAAPTDSTGKRISFYLHDAVAKTFIPNPENKLTVDHIDGNRLNNHYTNLRWATHKEQAENIDRSAPRKCRKPIYQLDENMKIIKKWDGSTQVHKETGIAEQTIIRACKQKKFSMGFNWRYWYDIEGDLLGEVWERYKEEKYEPIWFSTMGRAKRENGNTYTGYNKNGYRIVELYLLDSHERIIKRMHRMVSKVFNDRILDKDIVNHLDGNRSNNVAENLEFTDVLGNNMHAIQTGLVLRPGGPRRPVIQYDINWNELGRFESVPQAKKMLGLNREHIVDVCNGKRETAAGFRWKYVDDIDSLLTIKKEDIERNAKPERKVEKRRVIQYSTDGTEIARHNSIKEANEALGKKALQIMEVCTGTVSSSGGFFWQYEDMTEEERLQRDKIIELRQQRKLEPSCNSKPIIQLDLQQKEIARFTSVLEASELLGIHRKHIDDACRDPTKIVLNSYFKYVNERDVIVKEQKSGCKPVIRMNSDNTNPIFFKSVAEAMRNINIGHSSTIYRAIQKSSLAHGYLWRRPTEEEILSHSH